MPCICCRILESTDSLAYRTLASDYRNLSLPYLGAGDVIAARQELRRLRAESVHRLQIIKLKIEKKHFGPARFVLHKYLKRLEAMNTRLCLIEH